MTVDILDLNKIISNPFSFIQPEWSKSKRLHPQSTSSRRPSQPREQPPTRRSSRGEGEAARFQLPMQRSCSKVELIFQNTSAMTPSLPAAFHFIDPGSLDYSCCLSCTPSDCRKPRYCNRRSRYHSFLPLPLPHLCLIWVLFTHDISTSTSPSPPPHSPFVFIMIIIIIGIKVFASSALILLQFSLSYVLWALLLWLLLSSMKSVLHDLQVSYYCRYHYTVIYIITNIIIIVITTISLLFLSL